MKNDPSDAYSPYEGYRGAAPAQPREASSNFPESSLESYHPPSEGGYQQQEQPSGSQQHDGYEQPYYAPPAGSSSPHEKISLGMQAPAAGWLSYLGTWITGLIFLLLKKEDRFVRFHAMQSLIFFGPMSVLTIVFSQIPLLVSIAAGLWLVSFICWIALMVKAAHGSYYKLPIVGDLAEQWADSLRG